MSKSDDSPQGTILVLDDAEGDREEDQVGGHRLRTPRSATTATQKPGVSNLLEIYGAVTGRVDRRRSRPSSRVGSTARFKSAVADAVVEFLRPVQERYAELDADPAEVDRRLALGAEAAEAIAERVLAPGHESRRTPAAPPDR